MEKIVIDGGVRLEGSVRAGGSKNAALPLMAAALLADGKSTLTNIPKLKDVRTMADLVRQLGATVEADENTYTFDCNGVNVFEASYDLVRTMRASVLVLGPLVARWGKARVSLPGGCAIGERPVDQHLRGLEKLGADITLTHGYVEASAPRLKGARIHFDMQTVGGTENVLMAAVLAEGKSTIENAAREPEIVDLANYLKAMGADIEGAGTDIITVHGVDSLSGCEHEVISDRIEAGTFLVAAAITGGDVTVTHVVPAHHEPLLDKLSECGVEISTTESTIRARMQQRPKPINLKTWPFPGFPTDMQAQMMALLAIGDGASVISETVFENRFMHVSELRRMGADVLVEGRTATVQGVKKLLGAPVMASDLRASAALILAGLAAEGQTTVNRIYHLDRGYEKIERKLSALGAKIERVNEPTLF